MRLDILKQYSSGEEYSKNIIVKTSNERIFVNNFDVHFMVADSTMYRLEYDTKGFLAEFSFNGTQVCIDLIKKFNKVFTHANSVDLSSLPY